MVRVDRRIPRNILPIEAIPRHDTFAIKADAWRQVLFILNCFQQSSQFDSDKKRRKLAEASLLYIKSMTNMETRGSCIEKLALALVTLAKEYFICQLPRSENSNVDALACLASAYEIVVPGSVPVEVLNDPSIVQVELMDVESSMHNWMDPFNNSIGGKFPPTMAKTINVSRKATYYIIQDDKLRFSLPL